MIFENDQPHDFVYIAVNRSFERLTGLQGVVGKKITEVIPRVKETNPELFEIYGRVASTGKPEKFEMYLEPLKIWFSVSVYSTEIGTFVAVFENVTERKTAEEKLRKYNRELEASNRELEAFSYSASHDLRAPLRTLEGFSQILLEDYSDRLDETGKEHLNSIKKASYNMSQLIDGMLKLSRITRVEMSLERINLADLARTIASGLKAAMPDRRAEFIIPQKAVVDGDRQLLEILVTNLFENAWKFASKCPETRIELGSKVIEGKLVYYVQDNGVGFDLKYAAKLFQPFQRLHTNQDFPGTGIGLAITQRVVQRHGGRIWAESEIGKGSTFYFTLEKELE